jgi:exoribonuclease R
MKGTLVLKRGVNIVEYCGERLYLNQADAKGYQIGDTIEFDEIIHDTPMRRVGSIIGSAPQRDNIVFDGDVSQLLKKYKVVHDQPVDLTHLNTFSVDPEGSLDLDDALSMDTSRVYVHISFFQLNAHEDHSAFCQGESIYFPEKIYHLIPLPYARGKYSLLQNKLRLTWTAEFDLDMNFKHIYLAYIINKHQLTYQHDHPVMNSFVQIYNKYGSHRTEEIPTFHYHIVDGKMESILPKDHSDKNKMVEYFMIATNRAIATYLTQKEVLFPRRVNGYYTLDQEAHSELTVTHYTHFTSPIRRYIDQVVSRILLGESFSRQQLQEICTQSNINQQKNTAMNEEYLQKYIREHLNKNPIHTGVVSYVSQWGIHVFIPYLKITAQLHVSKLAHTDEKLIYKDDQLVGYDCFKVGTTVKLEHLDGDNWAFLQVE